MLKDERLMKGEQDMRKESLLIVVVGAVLLVIVAVVVVPASASGQQVWWNDTVKYFCYSTVGALPRFVLGGNAKAGLFKVRKRLAYYWE
jgi:ABC-type dipeptide/oligopeptide/nickel transport system permease component